MRFWESSRRPFCKTVLTTSGTVARSSQLQMTNAWSLSHAPSRILTQPCEDWRLGKCFKPNKYATYRSMVGTPHFS